MMRLDPSIVDYYDNEVTRLISDKYGYETMAALRLFVSSETHAMLEDAATGMMDFGAGAVFDLWEAERVTGNPRNSIYVRGD